MTEIKKCLYCGVEVPQTPGRRERKFCNPSHTSMWHQKKKNENKPKGKRGRPPGSLNKINTEKLKQELEQEKQSRSNPLINAARGRDSSGVNEDEMAKQNEVGIGYDLNIKGTALLPKDYIEFEGIKAISQRNEGREYNVTFTDAVNEVTKGGFMGIIPAIEKADEGKNVERDARKNVTKKTIEDAVKDERKPKLSPFMLARQKAKGGGK